MARPDGVVIVSERYWAFAGVDGSLREGPMRQPPELLQRVPLARGLVRLYASLAPLFRRDGVAKRRERWLMANPLCCDCQAEGVIRQADEVDHDVPLWKGGADDESNYKSRCKPHHAAKTAREAADRARGG